MNTEDDLIHQLELATLRAELALRAVCLSQMMQIMEGCMDESDLQAQTNKPGIVRLWRPPDGVFGDAS